MDYITRVLGIEVVYSDEKIKSVPNFIRARYRLQKVELDEKKAVFLYPKMELEAASIIKKHIERIQETEEAPAVLILNQLTYRQKEYFLRDHIPFVVEGKQIYLPFMALYLQERGDGEKQREAMLPSTQILLLYYIYHGCGELMTSEAVMDLDFTPTSISRASRQLEEMGLVQTEKRGVQKVIHSQNTPEEMFVAASEYFRSPVKKTIYVPRAKLQEKMLISGYQALSEYSMLNPSKIFSFATDSITSLEKFSSNELEDDEDQCAVELWRYDPRKLAICEYVDRLSLAIAFKDDKDERIEEAVEEMLAQVWRDIDGTRNREL